MSIKFQFICFNIEVINLGAFEKTTHLHHLQNIHSIKGYTIPLDKFRFLRKTFHTEQQIAFKLRSIF